MIELAIKLIANGCRIRLKNHQHNLSLWYDGTLNATVQDEQERYEVIAGLEGAIGELEFMIADLEKIEKDISSEVICS